MLIVLEYIEKGQGKNLFMVSLLIRSSGWVGVWVGVYLSWGSGTGNKRNLSRKRNIKIVFRTSSLKWNKNRGM